MKSGLVCDRHIVIFLNCKNYIFVIKVFGQGFKHINRFLM